MERGEDTLGRSSKGRHFTSSRKIEAVVLRLRDSRDERSDVTPTLDLWELLYGTEYSVLTPTVMIVVGLPISCTRHLSLAGLH